MRTYFNILKKTNPESQFIVFTTPLSRQAMTFIMKLGLFEYYAYWLIDAVASFGQVYNFMYPNSVTNNFDNFQEGIHFYPEVGQWIADKVSGMNNSGPKDFGILLNESNIVDHLIDVEKKLLGKNN